MGNGGNDFRANTTDGIYNTSSVPGVTTTDALNNLLAGVGPGLTLKGGVDCSTNPNYQPADEGDLYYVTVAGRIGGAAGKIVDVGDAIIAANTNPGGTEAAVGTDWFVLEHNIPIVVDGNQNPNAVVTGLFGQEYYDRPANIWYKCTATPSGTVWKVF